MAILHLDHKVAQTHINLSDCILQAGDFKASTQPLKYYILFDDFDYLYNSDISNYESDHFERPRKTEIILNSRHCQLSRNPVYRKLL